jgi:PAS domain S-box-containing protein
MRFSQRFLLSLLTSSAWWLGTAISLVLALLVTEMVEDKTKDQFDYQVNNAQLAIQNRVHSYIDVLRGTSALFSTGDDISREQFHAYVEHLQLQRSFPGVTNLNFARRVPAASRQSFEAGVRAEGAAANLPALANFHITPPGERSEYHVLTYLEPLESNLVSLGRDIAATPEVRRALEVSRDTGQLTSSGKLIYITGPHQHVGLAMRMPIFRRGMPTSTPAERRAAYIGSLGAGFDINKLLNGALDRKNLASLRLRLYDLGQSSDRQRAGVAGEGNLLYDTGDDKQAHAASPGFLVKRVTLTVGPRVWEAEFSASKKALQNSLDTILPWLVLLAGLAASTLLYSIYYSLTSARRRAVEMAREMTKDLRASEASLAEAQEMAHLGSWLLDPATRRMTWSAETFHIFGLQQYAFTPDFDDFLRRIHDEDRARIHTGLQCAIDQGEEFTTEHRIRQRDGTLRWVKTIARTSREHGVVLLRGTIMDITELRETMEALNRSRGLLRELTAHQDRVKEEERRRIAREIHDELGQNLLALRIDVSMLDARTGRNHPRLNRKVRDALQQIDTTVKTIRTIINNLRPAVLDLGLFAAIEWQVNEFRRRSGISCDLVMDDEEEFNVNDVRATALFRVLQESLTNVIRHANATHVLVEVRREGGRVAMRITDNGVGMYPSVRKPVNSFGLIGVEERIHALNGEFRVNSTPGKGTALEIFIPIEEEDAPAESLPAH